jgi:Zn finger protein HypA/HybF involved in hydrogenase expression
MGTTYLFQCDVCGYKAELSGGRDSGFVALLQTMTCQKCNELVDVIIGAYGKEGKTENVEINKALGLCPKCKGSNVDRWDERKSCPKCDGKMIRGEVASLWD